MSYDYKQLEVDLLGVLADLGETLTPGEVQEVRLFIDAGEYGVAFETLCSILKEELKPISPSLGARLLDLGQRMEIEPEYWRDLKSS